MEHHRDRVDEQPRDDPAQCRCDEYGGGPPDPPDEPRQREPDAEREYHPDEDLDVIHMADHCKRGSRGIVPSLFRRQAKILVRGGVRVAGDEAETGLRHTRADAIEEAELPARGVHGLVMHELLHLLEDRLPFWADPARLLLHEPLDVRVGPVGVDAGGGHEGQRSQHTSVQVSIRVAALPKAALPIWMTWESFLSLSWLKKATR
jgi:hypothetical protein